MIEHPGPTLHAVALDDFAIPIVQVLAQTIEIAMRAGRDPGRPGGRAAGSSLIDHYPVGGFLVPIFTLGQGRDVPPERLFKSARSGLPKGKRRAQRDFGRDVRAQIADETSRGL